MLSKLLGVLPNGCYCQAVELETEREKETPPSTPLQKKPPLITHRKPKPHTHLRTRTP